MLGTVIPSLHSSVGSAGHVAPHHSCDALYRWLDSQQGAPYHVKALLFQHCKIQVYFKSKPLAGGLHSKTGYFMHFHAISSHEDLLVHLLWGSFHFEESWVG